MKPLVGRKGGSVGRSNSGADRSVVPALPEDLSRLRESLLGLHGCLEEHVRARWRRSLPFQEVLLDRWERARRLGFGEGTSIYDSSLVFGDVRVGRHTWIGPYTVLDGSGGLRIGSYCSIAAGAQIYTHDTVRWAVTKGRMRPETSSTRIGASCYIGSLAVVDRGVRIGARCVVGAHSFVNRDLPDGSIAVGAPCRVVGRVRVRGGRAELMYFDDDRLGERGGREGRRRGRVDE